MTKQEIAVEIVKLALKTNSIEQDKVLFDKGVSDTIISWRMSANVKFIFVFEDDGDSIEPFIIYGDAHKPLKIHNITKVIKLFRSMK